MADMQMGQVVKSGLVAGLIVNVGETILNIPVAGAAMESALEARNLPPVGGGAIAYFIAITFVLGIVMMWLYAAVRPRLGAGPKTAVIVALVVWFLAHVSTGSAMAAMGIMPMGLTLLGLVWGMAELVVAALAGAWLYSEGGSA